MTRSIVELLFGYARRTILGRPVETLLPERLRDTLRPLQCTVAVPSLPGARSELVGRRKDGSEFHMEVGLNPVRTREEGASGRRRHDMRQRQE